MLKLLIRKALLMESIKEKTISGLFWRFFERIGAELVSFIVSIVLARLLSPDDYGLIALVTVFIAISTVFVNSGLGTALVQKKDADQIDFSTVFYFNVFTCGIIYLALFFFAPLIAKFYSKPDLIPVIRVLSLTIIISAIKNVQSAYVSKNMLFRRFFFSTIGGTIGAAVVGIAMAYCGFGVWALVAQQLFNNLVDTIILWLTVRWRPTRHFSLKRLRELFSFGWKILASSLLHTFYTNLRTLIIGKVYTSADLAYYEKGRSFPNLVVTNINSSIDSVLLPVMSSAQDDKEMVKNMCRRSIMVSSYLMWPMMIGLAVIAKPLISILLTEKWLLAVPYLQIACISLGFEPLQTANLNAIKSIGRSDIFFRLEIIKKIIAIIVLIISVRYGVLAIALSGAIYSFIASIINSSPNRKLLNYSYFDQIRDVLPSILLSLIMAVAVYPMSFLINNNVLLLCTQIVFGAVVFVVLSWLLKVKTFKYCINMLNSILKK